MLTAFWHLWICWYYRKEQVGADKLSQGASLKANTVTIIGSDHIRWRGAELAEPMLTPEAAFSALTLAINCQGQL